MLDGSRRQAVRRHVPLTMGLLLGIAVQYASTPPALAMCCLCRSCAGAAFCTDGVAGSVACANFCVAAGCNSTVFDGTDTCAGGCDGQPDAPTATPSSTASGTPTATATETMTATPPATPSQTPMDTPTASASAGATETPTQTGTLPPSATPTATPSATPTASPTASPALAGQIRYYGNDGPVPNVDVALIGDTTDATTTDLTGGFGFTSLPSGMLTLEPSKQDDVNAAVTALDASFILQFVAGLHPLDDNQLLAADVTGNGTVSALDAARILQFQAGLGKCSLTITTACSNDGDCPLGETCNHRFDAATACGSDWVFRPSPTILPNQTLVQPQISGGMCQRGGIEYSSITPPVPGQDFVAILFGDVTGNWTPP